MTRIICHSDDAGATPAITRRILDAWRSGLLDGFSVEANGESCAEISACIREHADRPSRLAVHLNLSEGMSSAPPEQVPLLVDERGILCHGFVGLWALWLRSPEEGREQLLKQVEKEWRMQIGQVKAIVRPHTPAVVDSHNHVHMLPFLFPLAAQLAREEGIPAIRISYERFYFSPDASESLRPRFVVNILKHMVLRTLALRARAVARRMGLTFPQSVIGVLYTSMMSVTTIGSGVRAARRRGSEDVEVILHIGRADPSETKRWAHVPGAIPFFLSEDRDREFEALRRFKECPGHVR